MWQYQRAPQKPWSPERTVCDSAAQRLTERICDPLLGKTMDPKDSHPSPSVLLSKFSEQRATTASTDLSNPRITGDPKRKGRFVLSGILLHENCPKPCALPCRALFSIQRYLLCLCSNRFITYLNPPGGDISCKEYRMSTAEILF